MFDLTTRVRRKPYRCPPLPSPLYALVLVVVISWAAGCGAAPSAASQPPSPVLTVPVTFYAPSPTPLPTATPVPTPTPIPITTTWIDPRLPEVLREELVSNLQAIAEAQGVILELTDDPAADLNLGVGTAGSPLADSTGSDVDALTLMTRTLAVAAPFPTVPDSIAYEDLVRFWSGDSAGLAALSPDGTPPILFVTPDTVATLSALLGKPSPQASIQQVGAAELVEAAWAARPASFAILPFDQLEPRWKLLHVDGLNLFDKQMDATRYPLALRIVARGDLKLAAALPTSTDRDVNKMAIVAMTGVTAMVRGTAVQMERKGITYPGEQIRDWLVSADIAHISNEVSFWEDCPPPSFNDGVSMCSNPKYIELLQYVGTDIIELSGNHLWDKGWRHLLTTLDLYDELGWPYFAGGRNLADAWTPATLDVAGNRIAFVGCNWFGADWATDQLAGSAPCGTQDPRDLDWITAEIGRLKEQGYLVIATIQYQEYYTYQATQQQIRDFAALRDAGAVVVNGSQGHHAQGFDVNADGFIHYGTGNFFFGDQSGVGTHQTFVDRHAFYDGRYLGADLRTAYIQDFSQPVPMSPEERAEFLDLIFKASGY